MKQSTIRCLIILLLCCNIQILCSSEKSECYLAVWNVDGEVVTFDFKEKPKITYLESAFTISLQTEEFEFDEKSISQFTLSAQKDVSALKKIEKKTFVKWNENKLELISFIPNTEVVIYTISGQIIIKSSTDEKGDLIIDLSAYQQQIYIVHTKNLTFKIVKK